MDTGAKIAGPSKGVKKGIRINGAAPKKPLDSKVKIATPPPVLVRSRRIREKQIVKEILNKSVFALPKNSPRIKKIDIERINKENAEFIKKIQTFNVNDVVKEKWCEPIYINSKCRSANLFRRLYRLPKCIGPGPLSTTIQDTLNLLIASSHEQMTIFYKWLCEKRPVPDKIKTVVIKAKTKKNNYYGPVRSIHHPEDLAGFCKEMCLKIGVCPNLFGTKKFTECPECSNISDYTESDESKSVVNGSSEYSMEDEFMSSDFNM